MRFASRGLCEVDDSSEIGASHLSHARRHVPAWVFLQMQTYVSQKAWNGLDGWLTEMLG